MGCYSPSSCVPVWAAIVRVSPMAFQFGAVSTNFFQWCSSVPCKYSLGRPVVSQCTLGQPVAFKCTLEQPVYTGSGYGKARKGINKTLNGVMWFIINNLINNNIRFYVSEGRIKKTFRWMNEISLKTVFNNYCQISDISRTISQNLIVSRLVLESSLPNPLKTDVKSRMKMKSEQHRQAINNFMAV